MRPSSNSRPKTFAEFEAFRKQLFSTSFKSHSLNPISIGIERCEFEAQQLRQLTATAEGVEGRTVRQRLDGWKRQLARTEENKKRFEALKVRGIL